jgi:c-di-GMP-binding flagellar brake protein YcgR
MYSPKRFEERRKHLRFQIVLSLEFEDAHGAVVYNLSEGGLLIHSVQNMPVGRELKVRVFFAEEYEFDQFKATARIAWKGYHSDADWEGYKYALEFIEISAEDRKKLVNLLEETP